MSELAEILRALKSLQSDVTSIKVDVRGVKSEQEVMRKEQEVIKQTVEEIRKDQESTKQTVEEMKQEQIQLRNTLSSAYESISKQLAGLVGDFAMLGDNVYQGFHQWAEQARSRVVDDVLAIHGPRIDALTAFVRQMKPCAW
jgi:dsDNA-specific endonuclease/ATPase MutS2